MAAEIFQAITAGRAAVDGLKVLSQYADEVKDVQKRGEFMRVIGNLSLELAETQMRLAEQIRENNSLRERIDELENAAKQGKDGDLDLVVKDGAYYTQDDDGPFCTACYDNNQKKIRLTDISQQMMHLARYRCNVCKAVM